MLMRINIWSGLVALMMSAGAGWSAGAPGKADLRPQSERFASLAAAAEPSFRRHVVPLLSRTGCSGRECHGSFAGQGGFQLSLFGYDFDKDLKAMTVDANGGEKQVRIDRTNAAKSLLLTKPTMEEHHKGKKRLDKGSWEYNLVLKWIQSGAKGDVEATGEFDRLEILPREIVAKAKGETVQLRVMAYWKDGAVEDVTQITRFRSNDDSVSTVSPTGVVTVKDRGDTHIVAFYDNGVLPVPVMLPVSERNGPNYPPVAAPTKVDALVVAKLRKLGIVPSEVCTDAEFLRRVTIDLTGGLPTPEQVTKFLADPSSNKRSAKVDELLRTPAYAAWTATRLSDYLGNNPAQLRPQGAGGNYGPKFSRQWFDWMYERVLRNEPYDKLVEGVVLATGRTRADQTYEDYAREMSSYFRKESPANFAERPNMPYFWLRQNVRKPEEKALAFAHSFLGVRIECAQCHKHPFDQWTQSDFKKFQAFFEGIEYGSKASKDEKVTYASLTKELRESVPPDPKGGNNQKALADSFEKRVQAGEPAPWQELFVSNKGKAKLSDKELARLKASNAKLDGRVLTPKILGGDEVLLNEYPDPRVPLMQWMRGTKNPYFARAFVNRVWAGYFGRGLVEPADDMNLANPPVNRELMDYLADGFAGHNYDMAWLHREILTSDTYQRSWKPNATNQQDEKNFSRMVPRRLPAEVVVDAISQATLGSDRLEKFVTDIENRAIGPNATAGTRKGGGNYSLNIFGKPIREANCDCERTAEPTILQTLFTRNDPEMLAALDQARGGSAWIDELRKSVAGAVPRKKGDTAPVAAKSLDLDKVVPELFLRTVSRPPTADELSRAKTDIAAAKTQVDGVRELLWAMLNTREFMVNH